MKSQINPGKSSVFLYLVSLFFGFLAACHSIALTRVPDAAPVAADQIPTPAPKPGPQQIKGIVIGKWKLTAVYGGITGKGAPVPPDEYYTFTADSFYIDHNGTLEKGRYDWREAKDLHTGEPAYLMTGLQWTFTANGNDSLQADMNVTDGYSYLLVRQKPVKKRK